MPKEINLKSSEGIGHYMTFTHALYSTLVHMTQFLQHDEEGIYLANCNPTTPLAGQDLYGLVLPLKQPMLTLPEIKYRIGVDSSQFLPVMKCGCNFTQALKKARNSGQHAQGGKAHCSGTNKFGQVLHLPEVPVHSCVQSTPTSQGAHTHTQAHTYPHSQLQGKH